MRGFVLSILNVYSLIAQLNEVKVKHKEGATVDLLDPVQAGSLGMVTGRGFGFRGSQRQI